MSSKKLFIALVAVMTISISVVNFLPSTQKISQHFLDRSFDRALVSFAVAKSLNALISVVQGTEIAATPAGLGVVFAAGEALDPFNDMVERFSWVMLASTVSLGIQKILLAMTSSGLMQYMIAVLGVLLIAAMLLGQRNLFGQAAKLFLFLAIIRFSIPLLALGNEALYLAFLSPTYTQATQTLQSSQETAAETFKEAKESSSWFDKVKGAFDDTVSALNVKTQIESLKKSLDESFKEILSLITIFIVQTILSPLLFFYLFIKLLKSTLRSSLISFSRLETLLTPPLQKRGHDPKY